ncbi:MAG: protein kinase family protein [Nocardioidaceae bacterium]
MDGREIEPGVVLSGRYRIEDLIGDAAGARSWRAFDELLNRSVGIEALPATDARCEALLSAARRSTAVTDPRFLRVLDAVEDEGGCTYLVREWARGIGLDAMLAEGPLPNRRAASVVGEVADALAAAHDDRVFHRRLDPSCVLVRDNGAVRIRGLATAQVLYDRVAPARPGEAVWGRNGDAIAEQTDVTALGKVLYACLVARWPGGRGLGLPAAPTEHGRLLRPRQVRAGVSREADGVCDRILGNPPRHHAAPLRSARDVAWALAMVGEDESSLLDDTQTSMHGNVIVGTAGALAAGGGSPPDLHPAVIAGRPRPPQPEPEPPTPLETARAAARSAAKAATQGDRALIWLGVGILVIVSALLAFMVGRQSGTGPTPPPPPSTATTHSSGTLPPGVSDLRIATASDFDPLGDGTENPEQAPLAVDGKLGTAWTTVHYDSPRLGNLKPGVGLLLDLGSDQDVTGIRLNFGTSPTALQIKVAPPGTTSPPTLGQMRNVATDSAAGPFASLQLRQPQTTRYVLVWLTSLPSDGAGRYQGVLDEVGVVGVPR